MTALKDQTHTPSRWFNEARYGLFIHWGPYSVAGRGEWVRNRERIAQDDYARLYADNWHAEAYHPAEWAQLAKDAGMGYVVLTTKHHDGFCLWGTDTTEFNAVWRGPKRDLLAPFVEAVREAGLKVGFYYSAADWHHPDYPDPYARDWPQGWDSEDARRRFVSFYRAQLGELMTRYGAIDMLWYDGCLPQPLDGAEVNAEVKRLQPGILINERNGPPSDFHCSEQAVRAAPVGTDWEACLTLNDNWGWHAGDTHYKSAKDVALLLTQTAAGAGNLLLNVGPSADGRVPPQSVSILREAGAWLTRNREFLPESTRCPFSWNNWGQVTTKGSRVYLHLFHSPGPALCWAEMTSRVQSVRMLATGKALPFTQQGEYLQITGLPVPLPDPIATTLVLDVEGEPAPFVPQQNSWLPG